MKISIVIPAYNEAEQISANLADLEEYMTDYIGSAGWEIIVINDGSTDNTFEILNTIKQKKEWLKVINLKLHKGRGKALTMGFNVSSGEIIVTLDADLSYAPYHIGNMVEKLEKENADIIVASAYKKNGSVKNVPFKRLMISRLGNRVLSFMFNGEISVLTCMVRAYKKDFIKRLDLHSPDKEIHLEILYKARVLGGKIIEIPADLHWKKEKLTKISRDRGAKRRSTLRMKKTSSSHLFFAMISRPGLMFWVPGCILFLIALYIGTSLSYWWVVDFLSGTPAYHALRNLMFRARISFFTMAFSFVVGIQFMTLSFLTNQNKYNYEELYKTCSTIISELRKKKE